MIVRRLGNDIPIQWTIQRNGAAETLSNYTLKFYIYELGGRKVEKTGFTTSGNVLSYTWQASDQKEPGTYYLILEEYSSGRLVNTVDSKDGIVLALSTEEQDDSNVDISQSAASFITDIGSIVTTYGSLEQLLQQALAAIETMNGLIDSAEARVAAMEEKIADVQGVISQAQQYALTYGSSNPYTDSKFDEAIRQAAQGYRNAVEHMDALVEAKLDGFTGQIDPIAITTMQAIIGSKQLQFSFIENVDDDTLVDYSPVVYPLYNARATYARNDRISFNGKGYRMSSSTPVTGQSPTQAPSKWTQERSFSETGKSAIYFPSAAIVHWTLNVTEISQGHSIHNRFRWSSGQRTELMEYDQTASYVYIKASKDMEPDEGEEEYTGDIGATGTFDFVVTDTSMPFEDDDYYYFLYMTVAPARDGVRSVHKWNGYTEITPGQIVADKLVSSDGTQYVDFSAGNHKFRIGGAGAGDPKLEYNTNGDGKLRVSAADIDLLSGYAMYVKKNGSIIAGMQGGTGNNPLNIFAGNTGNIDNSAFRVYADGTVYDSKHITSGYNKIEFHKIEGLPDVQTSDNKTAWTMVDEHNPHKYDFSFLGCDSRSTLLRQSTPILILPPASEEYLGVNINIFISPWSTRSESGMYSGMLEVRPYITATHSESIVDCVYIDESTYTKYKSSITLKSGFAKLICVVVSNQYIWTLVQANVPMQGGEEEEIEDSEPQEEENPRPDDDGGEVENEEG